MLQGSFVFQGCFKKVSRVFQECFKEVSKVFQENFWMLKESFKVISSKTEGHFERYNGGLNQH